MTQDPRGAALRRARSWVAHRVRTRLRERNEGGFILLESMIAITIITIVMGAVGVEFVGSVAATDQLRARQTAVRIASSTVDQLRALHPTDLLTGRGAESVGTQFDTGSSNSAVKPWLSTMDQASDATPGLLSTSGAHAEVPTVATVERPDGTDFSVERYLGTCMMAADAEKCVPRSTLDAAEVATAIPYLRAVVTVSWTRARCRPSCVFVTSTLISTQPEPTFEVGASLPDPPVIENADPQTTVAGDPIDPLQLAVKEHTGVPTYTWTLLSGSLPHGLSLSPSGTVTGKVDADAVTSTATVQVTDGFARTGQTDLTWTVAPALTLTDPGSQATKEGTPATLTLTAAGGTGAPYTFDVDGDTLPDGLTAAQSGAISGTPTRSGVWTVKVVVSDDAAHHTADGTFTWTVRDPLAPTTPGTRTSTVDTPIAPLTLTATGGDGGPYVWSDPDATLPAGLSISSDGVVTGTPTTVTDTAGKAVKLVVADPTAGAAFSTAVEFTWNVVTKPSVTRPFSQAEVTVGQELDLPLTTDCPNAPCTYELFDGPPGLSIDTSGHVSGVVGGTATAYPDVTVRVTDHQGVTSTSDPASLTVRAAPALDTIDDQTVGETATPSISIPYVCPATPCTISVARQTKDGAIGLGLSTDPVIVSNNTTTKVVVSTKVGRVFVTGLVPTGTGSTTGRQYHPEFAITDTHGVSPTHTSSVFTVFDSPTVSSPGIVEVPRDKSVQQTLTYACPAASCTVQVKGLPDGMFLRRTASSSETGSRLVVSNSSGTLVLGGQLSSSADPGDYQVTVRISRSTERSTAVITSSGTWTVR